MHSNKVQALLLSGDQKSVIGSGLALTETQHGAHQTGTKGASRLLDQSNDYAPKDIRSHRQITLPAHKQYLTKALTACCRAIGN